MCSQEFDQLDASELEILKAILAGKTLERPMLVRGSEELWWSEITHRNALACIGSGGVVRIQPETIDNADR